MTPEDQLLNVGDETGTGTFDPPPPPPDDPLPEEGQSKENDPIQALINQYDENEAGKDDPELPEAPEGQGPNVRLAKSRIHDALPSGRTNIGMGVSVIVPKKAHQLEGFHTEHAAVFVHQFPQYKFVVKKGSK